MKRAILVAFASLTLFGCAGRDWASPALRATLNDPGVPVEVKLHMIRWSDAHRTREAPPVHVMPLAPVVVEPIIVPQLQLTCWGWGRNWASCN